jgi:siroheme synthase (precorrin-2 oxidase/ferrochelatase)
MLSVSTGGAPALAAKVRDELVLRLDPRWVELAEATEALRPLIVGAKSVNAASRRAVLRELASDAALRILAESGRDGLRRWLEEHLAALSAEDRTVTGLTPNGAGESDCTTAEDASGTD